MNKLKHHDDIVMHKFFDAASPWWIVTKTIKIPSRLLTTPHNSTFSPSWRSRAVLLHLPSVWPHETPTQGLPFNTFPLLPLSLVSFFLRKSAHLYSQWTFLSTSSAIFLWRGLRGTQAPPKNPCSVCGTRVYAGWCRHWCRHRCVGIRPPAYYRRGAWQRGVAQHAPLLSYLLHRPKSLSPRTWSAYAWLDSPWTPSPSSPFPLDPTLPPWCVPPLQHLPVRGAGSCSSTAKA